MQRAELMGEKFLAQIVFDFQRTVSQDRKLERSIDLICTLVALQLQFTNTSFCLEWVRNRQVLCSCPMRLKRPAAAFLGCPRHFAPHGLSSASRRGLTFDDVYTYSTTRLSVVSI
jgi:hypothetical protein